MCRLCRPHPDDFAPSYASVLVAGPDLRGMIEQAEGQLSPCFTAWCAAHRRIAWIADADRALFPAPSAHHAHKLVLLARLKADLLGANVY